MVFEHQGEYPTQWKAIESIAGKLQVNHETLRQWVRRAEADGGHRPGLTSDEGARMKELERANRELRRAKEILRQQRLSSGRARPPVSEIVVLIHAYRTRFGVEPICRVLSEHGCPIAPNTFYSHKKRPPSARAVRDEYLKKEIRRLFATTSRSTEPTRCGPN
jgi:transposase-like protein